jgi:hypothetical protein
MARADGPDPGVFVSGRDRHPPPQAGFLDLHGGHPAVERPHAWKPREIKRPINPKLRIGLTLARFATGGVVLRDRGGVAPLSRRGTQGDHRGDPEQWRCERQPVKS